MLSTSCIVSVEAPWSDLLPPNTSLIAGADDALVVERAVLPETAILDRDSRLLERLRDPIRGDVVEQRVGADIAEQRSVGGVDPGQRVRFARLQLAQVGRRIGGLHHPSDRREPADHCRRRENQHGDHEHPRDRMPMVAHAALLTARVVSSSDLPWIPRRVPPRNTRVGYSVQFLSDSQHDHESETTSLPPASPASISRCASAI